MTMTLEEFRATKREVSVVTIQNAFCWDDVDMLGTAHGLAYDDNDKYPLYIEAKKDGTYYLLIGRSEYTTTDLAELEELLYNWVLTEI